MFTGQVICPYGRSIDMRTNNKHTGRRVHKRYRIKSNFRFITSLVIALCMIIGTGYFIMGFGDSTALTEHENQIEYVDNGETLWSIANNYKSEDTDVRDAIYMICQANDISADQLQSGMKLVIPYNL